MPKANSTSIFKCKMKNAIENERKTWNEYSALGKLNPLIERCIICEGNKISCDAFLPSNSAKIIKQKADTCIEKKKVIGYLANGLGFSMLKYMLYAKIIPKISNIGIVIEDPFEECKKELDPKFFAGIDDKRYGEVFKYWSDFGVKITPINNNLMKNSDCLIAILDGGPDIDSGVASEIGYYTGIKRGPIFAFRTDFRLLENIAAPINCQVLGYILQSGGKFVYEPNLNSLEDIEKAIDKYVDVIKKWYDTYCLVE
jgi:hypothetical protein